MRPDVLPPTRVAEVAAGLDVPADAEAQALSAFLAEAFGPATVAILHYGSRAQGRVPRPESAFDFFVVVDDNRAAYEALTSRVGATYSPRLAAWLGRRLAPNVIAVKQSLGERHRLAKCCVIALEDLSQAASPQARDHFCHGRLMQVLRLTWARDAAAQSTLAHLVAGVRRHTFAWTAPVLPVTFDVTEYLVAALRRSLAGEIRPEAGDHARTLIEAQLPDLAAPYGALLDWLASQGQVRRVGDGRYTLAAAPTPADRRRVDRYFRRSKARTTVRLLKHVVLYEGWLDYIVAKLERSGAGRVELSARERRWPLIFLWPRFIRFVWTRPQRRQSGDNRRS